MIHTPQALPPFIVSSVPKSGTHFIHQILNGMPNVHNDITNLDTKFFSQNPPVGFYEDHWKRLSQLKSNQFGIGHLHYDLKYKGMLNQLNLKHIYIYRDPRDVLVSLAHFIPEKWNQHKLFIPFKTLTMKDRLLYLIRGEMGEFPNFQSYFGPYYGWVHDPDTYKLRYEDLKGLSTQRKTIEGVARYLWNGLDLPVSMDEMVDEMIKQIDPGTSRTFRSGQTGGWRKEFDEEVTKAFKNHAGQMLIDAGYEKDHHW